MIRPEKTNGNGRLATVNPTRVDELTCPPAPPSRCGKTQHKVRVKLRRKQAASSHVLELAPNSVGRCDQRVTHRSGAAAGVQPRGPDHHGHASLQFEIGHFTEHRLLPESMHE